ncbi:hypothetical protein DL95DRAFT_523904 [Leptodontidium sp. 2 PMI_412]|nr:hypothetical protein DL95DRAFT_523904 [Leptodontidium sp. 2 PMI_412]
MASEAQSHTGSNHHFHGLGLHFQDKVYRHAEKEQNSPGGLSQQRVSGIGLRLTDSYFSHQATQQLTPGEIFEGEVSRWSSDSSEYEIERDKNSDNESESEEDLQEAMEDKLERHRQFFQGEPLMRCLKGEEGRYRKWMDTLFYDNLYHEVQHGPQETRSQEVVRAYWKEVREKLKIDDSEIEIPSDLDTEALPEHTQSSSHLGPALKSTRGWKRPAHLCLSSGKDLELQEIRHLWIDRKKNVRRAATFGKTQVQEASNTNPLIRLRTDDLGRAATFG